MCQTGFGGKTKKSLSDIRRSIIQHGWNWHTLAARPGEYLEPVFPLNVFLLLTAPHFPLFMCSTITQCLVWPFPLSPLALPSFLLDDNKEKYDFLFIQKTVRDEKEKWDPRTIHGTGLWRRLVKVCALLLRAAPSWATVSKLGVGRGPVVSVYCMEAMFVFLMRWSPASLRYGLKLITRAVVLRDCWSTAMCCLPRKTG